MKPLLQGFVIFFFYVALLGVSFHAYKTATQFSGLRTDCLIALIIAPLAAAICLAGLIHLADQSAQSAIRPWYQRVTLNELKRLLLALQILTTAVAFAATLALIFQFPIPAR
jgi:hypothetical protein